ARLEDLLEDRPRALEVALDQRQVAQPDQGVRDANPSPVLTAKGQSLLVQRARLFEVAHLHINLAEVVQRRGDHATLAELTCDRQRLILGLDRFLELSLETQKLPERADDPRPKLRLRVAALFHCLLSPAAAFFEVATEEPERPNSFDELERFVRYSA